MTTSRSENQGLDQVHVQVLVVKKLKDRVQVYDVKHIEGEGCQGQVYVLVIKDIFKFRELSTCSGS